MRGVPFVWLKAVLPLVATFYATITTADPMPGNMDVLIGLICLALAAASALIADACFWRSGAEEQIETYTVDTVPLGQEWRTKAGLKGIKRETFRGMRG